ncbi:PREDICTED: uncharacterized protein LOC102023061 [Chinchilla lanigera]|uniref:uncharacterized protein LOC102023061 n=1 Tax=Chinchilla lanigera TaxID=34839 RepID=UPI00038EB87A|nr:PREDICTED: uncharacterized protein LOC102023061 [Chinchilla lanigera]
MCPLRHGPTQSPWSHLGLQWPLATCQISEGQTWAQGVPQEVGRPSSTPAPHQAGSCRETHPQPGSLFSHTEGTTARVRKNFHLGLWDVWDSAPHPHTAGASLLALAGERTEGADHAHGLSIGSALASVLMLCDSIAAAAPWCPLLHTNSQSPAEGLCLELTAGGELEAKGDRCPHCGHSCRPRHTQKGHCPHPHRGDLAPSKKPGRVRWTQAGWVGQVCKSRPRKFTPASHRSPVHPTSLWGRAYSCSSSGVEKGKRQTQGSDIPHSHLMRQSSRQWPAHLALCVATRPQTAGICGIPPAPPGKRLPPGGLRPQARGQT